MDLHIGELRHRLVLEQVVRQDDGSGGADETWEMVDELWAAVRPVGGQEGDVSDQLSSRVSHEIWVRYRAGVKPEMRLRGGTRIFEVRVVIDVGERRRYLKCMVEERDL